MDQGRVQQLGTAQQLYERPASSFVAGFIGSPRMNFIEVRVDSAGAGAERVVLRTRAGKSLAAAVDASGAAPDAQMTLGIRPEDLVPTNDEQAIAAKVALIEWLGNVRFAYLDSDVADEPLIMQLRPEDSVAEGAAIRVSAPPERCHLFDSEGRALQRSVTGAGSRAA
jgi:multiple sugar transport system ATP-binding protein